MAYNHMKSYLTPLEIRDMHVQIKMRYQDRMALIKQTDDTR